MIVICEKCFAKYSVPDNAISPAGRAVKCTACSHTWTQFPTEPTSKPAEKEQAPPPGSALQALKQPKKASLKLKFASIVLFFGLVGTLSVMYQPMLYKISPGIANLYNRFGFFETDGLVFTNVDFRKIKKDEKYILLVKGEVLNTTDKKLKIPDIIITIFDKDGKKMTSLSYHLDTKTIKPGEKLSFEPKINNVPEQAHTMIADLGNVVEIGFRKPFQKSE